MDAFLASVEGWTDTFSDDESLNEIDFQLLDSTNNGRFNTVTVDDVDEFLRTQENENTKRKTKGDMSLFNSFLASQKESREPELIPPEELDNYIASFMLSVRKKDGSEYEPTTLRSYLQSIDRYLKKKKYCVPIITDLQFNRCREVLKSKQKQLKSIGKGNKPFAADPLSEEDIQKLLDANQLGPDNPNSLLHSMWLTNCVHFGIRTGKESRDLMWGDITLKEEDGERYLQYSQERQTKTRTGVNPRDVRLNKPRAYSTPEMPKRDPVGLYLLYKAKRPQKFCTPDSPFYISINVPHPTPSQAWYKASAMGMNKLYDITKEMKVGADLTKVDKRLTPYSARKHLMQKLTDEGVPPNQIIQISGHKNVNSLNNYAKINPDQSKTISNLLAGRRREQIATLGQRTATQTSSTVPPSYRPSLPGLFVGNTFQGDVHVHFHQPTDPQQPTSTMVTTTAQQFEYLLPNVPALPGEMMQHVPTVKSAQTPQASPR